MRGAQQFKRRVMGKDRIGPQRRRHKKAIRLKFRGLHPGRHRGIYSPRQLFHLAAGSLIFQAFQRRLTSTGWGQDLYGLIKVEDSMRLQKCAGVHEQA